MGKKTKEPGPTASEIEHGKIAADMWTQYKTDYLPVEKHHIADILDKDFQRAAGVRRGVGQAAKAEVGIRAGIRGQTRAGAAPGSGRFVKTVARGRDVAGGMRGRAAVAAEEAADTRALQNQLSVIAMGRRQQNLGVSTLSNQAQLEIAEQGARFAAQQQTRGAVGEAAGTAAGLYAAGIRNRPGTSQFQYGDPLPG